MHAYNNNYCTYEKNVRNLLLCKYAETLKRVLVKPVNRNDDFGTVQGCNDIPMLAKSLTQIIRYNVLR